MGRHQHDRQTWKFNMKFKNVALPSPCTLVPTPPFTATGIKDQRTGSNLLLHQLTHPVTLNNVIVDLWLFLKCQHAAFIWGWGPCGYVMSEILRAYNSTILVHYVHCNLNAWGIFIFAFIKGGAKLAAMRWLVATACDWMGVYSF